MMTIFGIFGVLFFIVGIYAIIHQSILLIDDTPQEKIVKSPRTRQSGKKWDRENWRDGN